MPHSHRTLSDALRARFIDALPEMEATARGWWRLRADAARALPGERIAERLRQWAPGAGYGYGDVRIGTSPAPAVALVIDSLLFAPERRGVTPLGRFLATPRGAAAPLAKALPGARVLAGIGAPAPASLPEGTLVVSDWARHGQILVWCPGQLPREGPVALRILPDPQAAPLAVALVPPVTMDVPAFEAFGAMILGESLSPDALSDHLAGLHRRALPGIAAASGASRALPQGSADDPEDDPEDRRNEDMPRLRTDPAAPVDRVALAWSRQPPTPAELAVARGLASAGHALHALAHAAASAHHGPEALARSWDRLARLLVETLDARHRAGVRDCALSPAQLLGMIRSRVAQPRLRQGMIALLKTIRAEIDRTAGPAPRAMDAQTERVLARIRALRARTTKRGCSEEEATVAARKLAELLERSADPCDGGGVASGRLRSVTLPLHRRSPRALLQARDAIAGFLDCRAWAEVGTGGARAAVYFGLAEDVAAAEALHRLVASTLATELARFRAGQIPGDAAPARRARASRDFCAGLVTRISHALETMKADRRNERLRATGQDLVERKLALVDAELERMGLDFHSMADRQRILDRRAWRLGMRAGEGFDPHGPTAGTPEVRALPPVKRPSTR